MSDILEWDIRVPIVSNVYVLVEILISLILFSVLIGAVVIYFTDIWEVYAFSGSF